jgi:hypothetical protein
MVPKIRVLAAAAAVAFVLVSPAHGGPAVPTLTSPGEGDRVDTMPVFAWQRAAGADKYEFQLAADQGFSSVVAYDFTRNTREAPRRPLPNGTYYWRVRASTDEGAVSPWSETRSMDYFWETPPALVSPEDGESIIYPQQPLALHWEVVPHAFKYRVALASDPGLSSLIGGKEFETQARTLAPAVVLAPGTYFWAVTPVDAEGNRGPQSEVRSFVWVWPSETVVFASDVADAPELFDPQVAWDPVPGAARYEVEINPTSDFAVGSRVCCTELPLGTSYSPTEVLPNNTYYWRVRAKDAQGNAGVWNEGEPFVKTFDDILPSVQNLRMVDRLWSDATDQDGSGSYLVDVPIIAWDPVPGAASYLVQVAPYDFGLGYCNWTAPASLRWSSVTATTAWTPLGSGYGGTKPFPSVTPVSAEGSHLVLAQSYCVRVAPRSGRVTAQPVLGDFTYLNGSDQPGFTWTGYPAGHPCDPSPCTYPTSDDYLLPIVGETTSAAPVFTWEPLEGKASYFVIVAKDPQFTNVVDYAFTQAPAYAPRRGTQARTYPDELTSYYWAVLPAAASNGGGAVGNPLAASPPTFEKQSIPPELLDPADGAVVGGPPTFRWTSAFGARRYRLQVSDSPTFSSLKDNVLTVSTAYTSSTTYAADTVLYWRVRADDENTISLNWSATGTFEKQLPAPELDSNPTAGSEIPTISWFPVPGAIGYDVEVREPGKLTPKTYQNFPSTIGSFVKMTGTGIFNWRVRAVFPTKELSRITGPYSVSSPYAKSIPPPDNFGVEAGAKRLSFHWDPRPAAKRYKIQVSSRLDFASTFESTTTENTVFAPLMTSRSYSTGGTFYARVAMVDEAGNTGEYTAIQSFDLPPSTVTTLKHLRLSARGYPVLRRRVPITITVKDAGTLAPVGGASVRVSGAGVTAKTKLTRATGRVRFYVRATRLGTVTFAVNKTGYYTASLSRKVRRP